MLNTITRHEIVSTDFDGMIIIWRVSKFCPYKIPYYFTKKMFLRHLNCVYFAYKIYFFLFSSKNLYRK